MQHPRGAGARSGLPSPNPKSETDIATPSPASPTSCLCHPPSPNQPPPLQHSTTPNPKPPEGQWDARPAPSGIIAALKPPAYSLQPHPLPSSLQPPAYSLPPISARSESREELAARQTAAREQLPQLLAQAAAQGKQVYWDATLDDKTTAECQSRHGKPYGEAWSDPPPIHFNCRSKLEIR
ncbi:MAG: hypothetical protein JJT96_20750 [Opitutales bacterium]|nr:hypothetical protein [Opitutales bacterium]